MDFDYIFEKHINEKVYQVSRSGPNAKVFKKCHFLFKKQVEKGGVLSEVRRREHYEKPSEKKKKKLFAAKKRVVKRTRRG